MKTPDMKHLGKALVYLRSRREMTATEVSERSGVTKAMLSGYERSLNHPSIETLAKILHGMGADFAQLDDALAIAQGEGDPDVPGGDSASLPISEETRRACADVLVAIRRLCTALLDDLGYEEDESNEKIGL